MVAGGVKDEEMPDAEPCLTAIKAGDPADGGETADPVANGGFDQVATAEGDILQQGGGAAAVNGDSEMLGQSQKPPPLLEV